MLILTGIKQMVKSLLSTFQEIRKNNLTLYLNHLLVVYTFLIPISERGKSAVFFTILLLCLVRGNFKKYFKIAIQNKIVQAMFFFFLIHIIWIYGTDNMKDAKNIIDDMKYLLFPLLFLSFLDKRFFISILNAFILGMFCSEVISYLIHFNILPYELILYGKEIYKTPAINNPSPFLDHARYGILLSLAIGFLLYNFLYLKISSVYVKSIILIFLITASFNLSLIGGRIGYISFIVIISFLILRKFKDNLFKSVVVLCITLSVILSVFYQSSDLFQQRVDKSLHSIVEISENNNFKSSIGQRIGIWIYSMNVAKDNLFFGVGTGDQLDAVKQLINVEHDFLKNLSHLHNEYFKNIVQFGIIGFLFYLNIFYQIFKFSAENKYKKDILIIVTLVMLTATLTSIFGSNIYLPLFVTIVAATISTTATIEDKFSRLNIKTLLIYILLVFSSLIIAFLQ